MWLLILIFSLAFLGVSVFFYLPLCFTKFNFVKKAASCIKFPVFVTALFIVILTSGILCAVFDFINTVVICLHLAFFFFIVNLILWITKKFKPELKIFQSKKYWTGLVIIAVTVLYFGWGYYQAHHVVQTKYKIYTDKPADIFTVALIADSHAGTTFDGKQFEQYLAQIARQEPDILVIAGDFIDGSTDRKTMLEYCNALKTINPRQGKFFVQGNHDLGIYPSDRREYTAQEFYDALTQAGMQILEDERVFINDYVCLIGRLDKSVASIGTKGRKTTDEFTKDLNPHVFTIVADHEPNDYADEAGKCDLVLSGHTHGGQMHLVHLFGLLTRANDFWNGITNISGTDFIVTSGISDWAIQFKTGCKAEYVIVKIMSEVAPVTKDLQQTAAE